MKTLGSPAFLCFTSACRSRAYLSSHRKFPNIKAHANGRNIVGQQHATLLGLTCCMEPQQCWHLLALVAYSLRPVKLLDPCKRTQHCWPKTSNNTQRCCDLLRPFAWAFRALKQIDIHNEILWNNRFITINGKSIWWKKWFDQGIIRVSDMLGPTGRTLQLADMKRKFKVDDWSYISLVGAILQDWKIILKSETDSPISRAATLEENIDYTLNIGGRTLKTDKLTNKLIYNSLRNKV